MLIKQYLQMQDIVKEDQINRRSNSYAHHLGFIRRVGSWPKNYALKFSHLLAK